MNKRTSIFYITTVVVAIACLILDLIFTNNSFSFLGICFALTMLVYGVCLIIRGFRFKIDSSLFLGIIIFVFGIISTMTYFTPWGYLDLWHYLLLGASLASFVTGIYFKTNTQKKLAILFLGLFVLAFLFQISLYNVWIMLACMAVFVVGFIIVNNIFANRRK
ncbi:MAG: hypothetical protein IJ371_03855 [Clostridia bacterium]|nr:hypothetical protein [Clostridia bacterium]